MNEDKPLRRRARYRFCAPMERHYLTKIASNAAMALSMAKEIEVVDGGRQAGIQELAKIIDSASRELINLCKMRAFELNKEAD